MKKVYLLLVTLMIILFLNNSLYATKAEASFYSNHLSVEEYIDYLAEYNLQTALAAGTSPEFAKQAVEDHQRILNKFLSLTAEQKTQFVQVISNPLLLESATSGQEIKGVQWKIESTVKKVDAMSSTNKRRVVSHKGTLGVLGIDITEYTIDGTYEYNSKGATNALSVQAYVSHNYNPTVVTDLNSYDKYVSNGVFYANANFSYKIGLGSVGIAQISTVFINVRGDENGKKDGSFYSVVK